MLSDSPFLLSNSRHINIVQKSIIKRYYLATSINWYSRISAPVKPMFIFHDTMPDAPPKLETPVPFVNDPPSRSSEPALRTPTNVVVPPRQMAPLFRRFSRWFGCQISVQSKLLSHRRADVTSQDRVAEIENRFFYEMGLSIPIQQCRLKETTRRGATHHPVLSIQKYWLSWCRNNWHVNF